MGKQLVVVIAKNIIAIVIVKCPLRLFGTYTGHGGKVHKILSTNANRMLIYDEIIITSGSNGPQTRS